MSSRRKNNNKQNDLGGSHPQEFKADHRHFLARSMERNDVDLAALLQLNSRLKATKKQIIESCGEIVLLDLGCGRLTLLNDELHEEKKSPEDETYFLTPAQKELCVDFLLLMKLRRKLANRLVRRLNRVAQAMDGNDVSPPSAPRYGDLRLHIDSQALQERVQFWERYDQAKKEFEELQKAPVKKELKKEEPPEKETEEEPEKKEEKEEAKPEEAGSAGAELSDEAEKKDEPKKEEDDHDEEKVDKPMDVDEPADGPASADKPVSSDSAEKEKPKEEPDVSAKEDPLDILREYEEAYDKVWDPETKQFKYALTTVEHAEDYKAIKGGAAIGASTRLLSEQEREQEYKRWQTTMLARIPHQPTFEDLGLKNRVFCLEQRRKRCLEEATKDEQETKEEGSPKKPKTDYSEDHDTKEEDKEEDMMKDDDKDQDEEKIEEEKDEDPEKKKDEDMDTEEYKKEEADDKQEEKPPEQKKITLQPRKKKEEEEDEEKEEEKVEELKRIKPMSLTAVPSFHDQDYIRIRNVHGDLIGSSILEEAKRTMAEAANEYNNALRLSNQIYDARNRLQQNFAYFMSQKRNQLAKQENDYRVQFAMAKQKWLKEKIQHDQQRAKQFLPSTWGATPYGTNGTQNYQRRGGLGSVVGSCLADVVDGVVIMIERNVSGARYPDFKPPPNPGSDAAQQITMQENELKRQLNDLNEKLQTSEERRKNAWIKMMKTKIEMDPNAARRGYADLSSIHRIPVPPLRNSGPQGVPRDFAMRAAIATFQPPPSNRVKTNDSKYSTSRIREKIGDHVTLAPVSEPKKGRDGLFTRPGRARKG
eukprot:CAMPEP_0176137620 /NCGR_PEP_ID=MMETSP0120_2-20121206/69875_1 /TAXON_ID=160619 /ORGANISM="Kryptoperidinium foliaceum, Strain CCMP 1326" /LENGTH=816 /DNA_ID=CAMNT_0017473483 /DNA_START=81 /DNA_END=2527 /DNA_ORIENTATION=-